MSEKNMPVLKDFRLTKVISLSAYEGSEIEIYNSVLARESDGLLELSDNPKKVSLLVEVLPKFIKSWNFLDENKNPLPVNSKTVDFLSFEDLTEIVDQVKEFSESLKKNSEEKPSSV